MSGEGKSYNILSVADFLQVPKSRRTVCLREFRQWLALMDAFSGIPGVHPHTSAFHWVDDDKGEARIRMVVSGPVEQPQPEPATNAPPSRPNPSGDADTPQIAPEAV
jgi:hypothetical protein